MSENMLKLCAYYLKWHQSIEQLLFETGKQGHRLTSFAIAGWHDSAGRWSFHAAEVAAGREPAVRRTLARNRNPSAGEMNVHSTYYVVGDANAPSLGSNDDAILHWAAAHGRVLVSKDARKHSY